METPSLTVEVNLQGEALDVVGAIVEPENWQSWLRTWLNYLSPGLSPIEAYELSLQFTSDEVIAGLNSRYRQQNCPTDVLAFAALDNASLPPEVLSGIPLNLGDLIISVDTAQRQCKTYGHSLRKELVWLVAHGLLHLLRWDHPDENHLHQMLSMQRELLLQIGLPVDNSGYFTGGQAQFSPL